MSLFPHQMPVRPLQTPCCSQGPLLSSGLHQSLPSLSPRPAGALPGAGAEFPREWLNSALAKNSLGPGPKAGGAGGGGGGDKEEEEEEAAVAVAADQSNSQLPSCPASIITGAWASCGLTDICFFLLTHIHIGLLASGVSAPAPPQRLMLYLL